MSFIAEPLTSCGKAEPLAEHKEHAVATSYISLKSILTVPLTLTLRNGG